MIKYVGYKDGVLSLLSEDDTIVYKTKKIDVKEAAKYADKTNVIELPEYDKELYYPANFRKKNKAIKYDLIPIDWKHPDREKRIVFSDFILLSPSLSGLFLTLSAMADNRELPRVFRGGSVSEIYLSEFNPEALEGKIEEAIQGYYKLNENCSIEISETQLDESWSLINDNPESGGLMQIQNLEYTSVEV